MKYKNKSNKVGLIDIYIKLHTGNMPFFPQIHMGFFLKNDHLWGH